MATLLIVNASVNPQSSHTRSLVDQYVRQWQTRHPEGRLLERDLAQNPPAHLSADTLTAFYTPSDQLDDAGRAALAQSDQLIEELKAADEVVFGVPMYNFSIPSALKAWIDQVCRAGVTFRYTGNGPEGLLKGKRATIISARGGNYAAGSAMAKLNFQDTYLKSVLGFIGITNVETVNAEGVASGTDGIEQAKQQLEVFAAS